MPRAQPGSSSRGTRRRRCRIAIARRVRALQETTAPLAVQLHLVLLVWLEAFALAVLRFRKVALVRRETTV